MSEKLEETRTELENLLAYQAQGAFVRARTKMQVEGEKPSKLFCSLERHNAVQKYIPNLNVQRNGNLQYYRKPTSTTVKYSKIEIRRF